MSDRKTATIDITVAGETRSVEPKHDDRWVHGNPETGRYCKTLHHSPTAACAKAGKIDGARIMTHDDWDRTARIWRYNPATGQFTLENKTS